MNICCHYSFERPCHCIFLKRKVQIYRNCFDAQISQKSRSRLDCFFISNDIHEFHKVFEVSPLFGNYLTTRYVCISLDFRHFLMRYNKICCIQNGRSLSMKHMLVQCTCPAESIVTSKIKSLLLFTVSWQQAIHSGPCTSGLGEEYLQYHKQFTKLLRLSGMLCIQSI